MKLESVCFKLDIKHSFVDTKQPKKKEIDDEIIIKAAFERGGGVLSLTLTHEFCLALKDLTKSHIKLPPHPHPTEHSTCSVITFVYFYVKVYLFLFVARQIVSIHCSDVCWLLFL